MEALGYAFGAIPFPSAGVGAPHIRDRLYWVGNAKSARPQGRSCAIGREQRQDGQTCARGAPGGVGISACDRPEVRRDIYGELPGQGSSEGRNFSGMADTDASLGWTSAARGHDGNRSHAGWAKGAGYVEGCDSASGMADTDGGQRESCSAQPDQRTVAQSDGTLQASRSTGPTNGHWRDADWLLCRDGKWRPVEPGTLPLAHGAPARVGRLRAYGNAINAQAAQIFIEATKP
jgi:DNA (cytosine-5)-methyltransferase 1